MSEMKGRSETRRNLIIVIAGALCIAMSFGLSFVKLFSMPMGGSVTAASMLPLSLFAFLFGPLWGIIAGVVYGLLQLLQKPEIVHWVQLLLDYPLAFGAIGLAGMTAKMRFREGFALRLGLPLGTLIGGVGRMICHIASGAIFFAEYAGEQNPWLYSFLYNGGYLGVDIAICIALAFFIPVRSVAKVLDV